MSLKNDIKKLSDLNGVSGFENNISNYLLKELGSILDECYTDNLGNIIAVKKSVSKNGSVMLEAHMDEIGLMVKKINKDGFLEVVPVGGIDVRILLGKTVTIHGKDRDYPGVVGAKPPHMMTSDEYNEVVGFDKVFIDGGFDYEFACENIPLGTVVTFDNQFTELKNDYLSSKCLDDRASVAVLLDVAKNISKANFNFDIYFCICVQEEVGLRGSQVAAYSVNPDFAVAIDVTHAKTPDESKVEFACAQGFTLCKGPNIHPALVKNFEQFLKDKEVPYEIEVEGGNTGTDAWAIQTAREGIPVMLLSLPLKYMHTPIETLCLDDCRSLSTALSEFLKSFNRTEDMLCF